MGGTANVLDAARHVGARSLVLASSCAVYGATSDLPVAETAPTRPGSPYARSKLDAERLFRAARVHDGLRAGVLRFFNVYGPRQDPSSDYSGVIAIFLERLFRGLPCTIYGDGRQTRDFVFVADVVAACRAALDEPPPDAAPLNVGTGVETSLLDVLAALAEASALQPAVVFGATRAGDIRRSWAACELAAHVLGFRSAVSLKEGMAATWSWYVGEHGERPPTQASTGATAVRPGQAPAG